MKVVLGFYQILKKLKYDVFCVFDRNYTHGYILYDILMHLGLLSQMLSFDE